MVIAVPAPMCVSFREKAEGSSCRRERNPKSSSWTTMASRITRQPPAVCRSGLADGSTAAHPVAPNVFRTAGSGLAGVCLPNM